MPWWLYFYNKSKYITHIEKKNNHFIEKLKQAYCDKVGILRNKLYGIDYLMSYIHKQEEHKYDWHYSTIIHNSKPLTEWVTPLTECGVKDNDIITVIIDINKMHRKPTKSINN